jgi:hypothetical protein
MAIPEFLPALKPSYRTNLDAEYNITRFRSHKGYEQNIPKTIRPLTSGTLTWNIAGEDVKDYIESFFSQFEGNVGPFSWKPFDNIATPSGILPALTESSGGSLSSRTYFVEFTWHDSVDGETKTSGVSSKLLSANNLVTVTVPPVPNNVEAFRVYASTTQGSETLQATITTGRSWTEPTSGLISGASPPSSNTLNPAVKFIFAGRLRKRRIGPSDWQLAIDIAEQLI